MIQAFIFDLDGLLADTESLHCRAYQQALLEHGTALDEADYCEHWVRSGKGIVDWIAARKLDLDPHALRLRKSARYLDLLLSSLQPMDGALELLDQRPRRGSGQTGAGYFFEGGERPGHRARGLSRFRGRGERRNRRASRRHALHRGAQRL